MKGEQMRIKTKYLGTITADELTLSRLAGVIEDAAAYNLEHHYIKIHGDLMEESKLIRNSIYGEESHRYISSTSQSKRSERTSKTAGSDK